MKRVKWTEPVRIGSSETVWRPLGGTVASEEVVRLLKPSGPATERLKPGDRIYVYVAQEEGPAHG